MQNAPKTILCPRMLKYTDGHVLILGYFVMASVCFKYSCEVAHRAQIHGLLFIWHYQRQTLTNKGGTCDHVTCRLSGKNPTANKHTNWPLWHSDGTCHFAVTWLRAWQHFQTTCRKDRQETVVEFKLYQKVVSKAGYNIIRSIPVSGIHRAVWADPQLIELGVFKTRHQRHCLAPIHLQSLAKVASTHAILSVLEPHCNFYNTLREVWNVRHSIHK